MKTRTAHILGWSVKLATVREYLPANYDATEETYTNDQGLYARRIVIEGIDHAGWTMDGYVIPRLASGWMFANEVTTV